MDIIDYAYEMTLNTLTDIDDYESLRKYFFQFLRTSTIWRNCKYHRSDIISNTGGRWLSQLDEDRWMNIEDEYNRYHLEGVYTEDDIPDDLPYDSYLLQQLDDKFENDNPTRDECLVYETMKKGHFTCGKFSQYTQIPRSTSYILIKNIKDKLKKYLKDIRLNQ